MLKVEDCKPGVEVIAIKNKIHDKKPVLQIGSIYTIRSFSPTVYIDIGKEIDLPVISLMEIKEIRYLCYYGYELDQFKLRRPEEFIELFDLNNIPLSLQNEELEKC